MNIYDYVEVDGFFYYENTTIASFYDGDKNVEKLVVPDVTTSLGGNVLPNKASYSRVEKDDFIGSNNHISISIPAACTEVGIGVFRHLKKLTEIHVDSGNDRLYSIDGILFRKLDVFDVKEFKNYPKADLRLCCYPWARKEAVYVVPERTTSIERLAFYNSKLQKIVIPDSVTNICDDAFWGCANLELIQANGLTTVNNIFGSRKKAEIIKPIICPQIALSKVSANELKLGLAMGFIISPNSYEKRSATAYQKFVNQNKDVILEAAKRHNLSSVICALQGDLPVDQTESDEINKDEKMSVREAESLFDIQSKSSGIKILRYKGADSVVTIPRTIGKTDVMLVDAQAFPNDAIIRCSGKLFPKLSIELQFNAYAAYLEKTVSFTADQISAMKDFFNKKQKQMLSLALESGREDVIVGLLEKPLKLDEYNDFIEKSNLLERPVSAARLIEAKRKHFSPEKEEKIMREKQEKEFATAQQELVIEMARQTFKFSIKDNAVAITGYKLSDEEINIPENIGPYPVCAIQDGAFSGCKTVKNVVIPQTVTQIGSSAFKNCISLQNISIPDVVTEIGGSLFLGCTALEYICLPESIAQIQYDAFYNCTNLAAVTISANVKSIADGAFDGCPNLAIHAPAGSYAEQYAKENNIPFVAG